MSERQSESDTSLGARLDQPLIAVVIEHAGQEEVRYFVDEADADAALERVARPGPLKLAGIWRDLDADAMLDELDRIRHQSKPTPPITTL